MAVAFCDRHLADTREPGEPTGTWKVTIKEGPGRRPHKLVVVACVDCAVGLVEASLDRRAR